MPLQDIILAEDNPRDREFLVEHLTGVTLHQAVDGQEALLLAEQYAEPLVISDIQMPRMNGIEFARALWQKNPAARILFWTQYDDEMYVRALAKIIPAETVYGYVLKTNLFETIEKAIHAVFEDCQCWIDPKVRPVQARMTTGEGSITDAEFEVLIDIALGLTDNAIARRHYLSRRGAQSRLKSLYQKLGADQHPALRDRLADTINLRSRTVALALDRGLLNQEILRAEMQRLDTWLLQED
ncbi:MAG: response regulator transcription factor [Gammaproteobacteria bacterium]